MLKKGITPFAKAVLVSGLYLMFVSISEWLLVYLISNFTFNQIEYNLYFLDSILYSILTFILVLYLFTSKGFDKANNLMQPSSTLHINIVTKSLIMCCLLYAFELLINILKYNYFENATSLEPVNIQWQEILNHVISVVLFIPIFEELVFRKMIIDSFLVNNHGYQGMLVSSISFTIIHFYHSEFLVSKFLLLFLYGLFFGYLYIRTRNIIYPIISHVTINGIWLILTFYQEEFLFIAALFNSYSLLYLIVIVPVFAFFILYLNLESYFKQN